jgi:leucyl/phenylalanyl-tRNA---protein transferase
MPIFLLGEEPIFPPAQLADEDGIIATGGDLSPLRLLNAYTSGIFPWYEEGEPILWWSPDPRLVLLPDQLHISNSMKKLFKQKTFQVTVDKAFTEVMQKCSLPRRNQDGTWISTEMKDAYFKLHQLGYAHSIEAWQINGGNKNDRQLVGGLYGVSMGMCFFGESMFALKANASKYAFLTFSQILFKMGFQLIDCQVPTNHLKTLGAVEIPRIEFLALLHEGLKHETLLGNWQFPLTEFQFQA